MEYLEAWGTLIHEKNLKSKISCQTPFKRLKIRALDISIKDDVTIILLLSVFPT